MVRHTFRKWLCLPLLKPDKGCPYFCRSVPHKRPYNLYRPRSPDREIHFHMCVIPSGASAYLIPSQLITEEKLSRRTLSYWDEVMKRILTLVISGRLCSFFFFLRLVSEEQNKHVLPHKALNRINAKETLMSSTGRWRAHCNLWALTLLSCQLKHSTQK